MLNLTAEQQQLAKIVHDYASQFPPTENVDAQLLQGCYDYMEVFKRVMESPSKVQMDYICLQYLGYLRFTKWMERLTEGLLMELLWYRKITNNIICQKFSGF